MYALSINIAGALTLHGYFHLSPATLSINIAGWSLQLLAYYHTYTHSYLLTHLHKHLHTRTSWPMSIAVLSPI